MPHPPRSAAALAAAALAAAVVASCTADDQSSNALTPPPTEATTTDATTTTVAPTTSSSTTSTTTTTSTTSTTTTTLPAIIRQPLTGEPIAGEADIVPRAALAVKIDNAPPARRNHSGLAVADVVFEELVGSGITRFVAIFHSTGSDPVGPIRSGRQQDEDIVASFGLPLFAWSGGNRGVTELMRNSPFLVDLNHAHSRGYYRGAGSSPNNLYNSTDALWAQTPFGHPGPPPQQWPYLRPEEDFPGEPVAGLTVEIGNTSVRWDWDAGTGTWLRSQQGGPHNDRIHGRIGATNVVVMGVQYLPSTIDARNPRALTVDSGPVWVFSDGEVVAGRWERGNRLNPLDFLDENNVEIALDPGRTWIELAPRIGDGVDSFVELSLLP